jgi:hypothetical protein
MNQKEVDLENKRMQINREQLIERMTRIAPENSLLEVFRASSSISRRNRPKAINPS